MYRQVFKRTLGSFAMIEVLTNKEKYYDKQLQANTIFLQKASREFDELVEVLKELIVD
ncbi:hypothetical protein PO902_06190 [Planococcus maritimus]|nr:hypothetical protein [Planococcus sp. SK3692]MDE4084638.1 hypothetical protein [Planococcus maritimus]